MYGVLNSLILHKESYKIFIIKSSARESLDGLENLVGRLIIRLEFNLCFL